MVQTAEEMVGQAIEVEGIHQVDVVDPVVAETVTLVEVAEEMKDKISFPD
jgi:hypothetical protein